MISATNKEKREKWKNIIDDQESSGLSQEEFCKTHNLSSSTFCYYRSIFRGKQESKKTSGSFTSVNISKSVSLSEIRLTLPNGFQCTFPADVDSVRIKELVGIFLSC